MVSLPASVLQAADRYAWNAQNVNEMQVEMARWLEAHAGAEEWVASVDAGAIRYLSGHPVLDLMGLNSGDVLEHGRVSALERRRPRYVVVFPEMFPAISSSDDFRLLHSVRAEKNTICPRCPEGDLELAVYEWVTR